MLKRMLGSALLLAVAIQGSPAQARPDDHRQDRREDRDDRRDRRQDQREDRREDRHDERFRAEQGWGARGRGRARGHYRYEDREHPGRYLAPPWMTGYWRPHERRYVALIPGDPSRCYVFVEGRWLLRRIEDPSARLDIEGAFGLPMAPPPIPPPHVGLGINLHVVLLN